MPLNDDLRRKFDELIAGHEVVLFMKGRRSMPQCGFSAQVVSILNELVDEYQTVNVLESMDMREGIKEYSNWPTIPQLYVKGRFVGGCDIVTELYDSGELQQLLGKEVPEVSAPELTVSETAAKALNEALNGTQQNVVRLEIDVHFMPSLDLDTASDSDLELEVGGVPFVVDRGTATRANGVSIDFIEGANGGFKIENPNEPPRIKALAPLELKARIDSGDEFEFIDVRTPEEREKASISGTKLLDEEVEKALDSLDRGTILIFHCHYDPRSRNAAQRFLDKGFKKVYFLRGGIAAWSSEVDPSIPKY